MMKGLVLKIIFKDVFAFLTSEVALDLDQVRIVDSDVRFKSPAYWIVRVINHIENEHRLFVEVLSYHVGETHFSSDQIDRSDILMNVERVSFKNIDTIGLIETMRCTETLKTPIVKSESADKIVEPGQFSEVNVRESVIRNYVESFSVPIKNVKFLSGKVSFVKRIPKLDKTLNFEIQNEDIIEEYDAVKNYLQSVLQTKAIRVTASITMTDGIVTSINSKSAEIEKIDKSFFEEVKFEIVKSARKRESLPDKLLFTSDEYLEAFTNLDLKTKSKFYNECDLFENLLKMSETKHYVQLRYLSSKHAFLECRLRFVHSPFSFIFLICSSNAYYAIWETLDTQEATYIWRFSKNEFNLNQVFLQVDGTLKDIAEKGKSEFIRRKERNFSRIFHDYLDVENGFSMWKEEFDKVISR